jgi:hypothetical protein
LIARIFSLALKNASSYYNAGVVVVNSKVVGLAPGFGGCGNKNFNGVPEQLESSLVIS